VDRLAEWEVSVGLRRFKGSAQESDRVGEIIVTEIARRREAPPLVMRNSL
jgi:hypothetical protein